MMLASPQLLPNTCSEEEYISIPQALAIASAYTGRNFTSSSLQYLIQYGHVTRKADMVKLREMEEYFARTESPKKQNDSDVPDLSFNQYIEKERTKHVHRLHPYKGKFIPQLVEYFIDAHTDTLKQEQYFAPGDAILDPFLGSGTTLVQAAETGMHAVGSDVSPFNVMIADAKLHGFTDIGQLHDAMRLVQESLAVSEQVVAADWEIAEALTAMNKAHFPKPEFMRKLRLGDVNPAIDIDPYLEHMRQIHDDLLQKHGLAKPSLTANSYIDRWYMPSVAEQIARLKETIERINSLYPLLAALVSVTACRAIRSVRATPHADLATLKKPEYSAYFCRKHGSLCRPLLRMDKKWTWYARDTIERLVEFDRLRVNGRQQIAVQGDARTIDFAQAIRQQAKRANEELGKQIAEGFDGIFTSPPYIGLIDYHEQHAYAYELLGLERHDNIEIGAKSAGQSRSARKNYVDDMARVLGNCKQQLKPNAPIFIVANDKWELYPTIAQAAGLRIEKRFTRPVSNRTEKDKAAYFEEIFLMRENDESPAA